MGGGGSVGALRVTLQEAPNSFCTECWDCGGNMLENTRSMSIRVSPRPPLGFERALPGRAGARGQCCNGCPRPPGAEENSALCVQQGRLLWGIGP